jgi:tripartite-type tricarboxylate transporter receptor subunit TctC
MTIRFFYVAFAGVAVVAAMPTVHAQNFPERPMRLIVPFAPGGTTDFLGRAVGQKLNEAWGQPVIVDNRPGAAGNIGTDIAAKAPADGYTIVQTSMSNAISMTYYRKLPYSLTGDLHAAALCATQPNALVAGPGLAARNLQEMLAMAKAKPGQLVFASSGQGGTQHMMGELLRSMTKVELVHVAYKGTALGLADVMSGQIAMAFAPLVNVVPQLKGGKVRALAVTSTKRASAAPDVPTMSEAGVPGYDVSSWYGLHAPIKTPKAIIEKINREVNRILELPDVRERMVRLGMDPAPMSADQFQEMSKSEVARWAKVIKDAGVRQE